MGFNTYADAERQRAELVTYVSESLHVGNSSSISILLSDLHFRHLKPGFGWLEHVEMDIVPRCDDGTLPSDSRLVLWSEWLLRATQETGRPLAYNVDTRAMLERHGFVEIQEQVIKVPLNPWPGDPHLKDIGRWYNLGLTQGLEALTLAPMMRVAEWPRADVDKLIMEAKREICTKRIHAYNNM